MLKVSRPVKTSLIVRQRRRNNRRDLVAMSLLLGAPTSIFAFFIRRQSIRNQVRLCREAKQRSFAAWSSRSGTESFIRTTDDATDTTSRSALPIEQLFDLQLPEGRCVGLTYKEPESLLQQNSTLLTNTALRDYLHAEEVAFALNMQGAPSNQLSFVLGRMAMRTILECNGAHSAILKDSHGRPALPTDYLGSISHKKNTAVALVARQESGEDKIGIGVDLEYAIGSKASIAPKILTNEEIRSLGFIEGVSAAEEVLLRFSIKESLYKAMHPLLCQYVGFHQVQVQPLCDGSATANFDFANAESLIGMTCHWRRVGEFFLSSASLRLKEGNRKVSPETDTKTRSSCEVQ